MSETRMFTYKPGLTVSIDVCFKIKYGPRTYRVGNLGHVGFISGGSGAKKSTYAKAICAAALSGREIAFNKVNIGSKKILYFDTEMPEDLFISHIDKMFETARVSPYDCIHNLIAHNLVMITDPIEKRKLVLSEIRKHGEELGIVVIDVIADLFMDENETDKAQEFVAEIASLAQEYKFMALIVSHVNDSGKILGSIGKKLDRKSSFGMSLEEVSNSVSTVNKGKTRYEPYPSFDIILNKDGIIEPGEYIPFPVEKKSYNKQNNY